MKNVMDFSDEKDGIGGDYLEGEVGNETYGQI